MINGSSKLLPHRHETNGVNVKALIEMNAEPDRSQPNVKFGVDANEWNWNGKAKMEGNENNGKEQNFQQKFPKLYSNPSF